MTPRRTGRRLTPAGVLAGVILAGTALVGVPSSAAARAAPDGGVDVIVESLEPRVVRPAATVQVSGVLISRADTDLTSVRVQLYMRTTAIGSRSELAAEAVRTTPTGTALAATTTEVIDQLAPGATAPFSVSVPARSLGLAGFGVYPFGVVVLADQDVAPNTVVGYTPTLLPWMPAGTSFQPTRIAWVLPLVDTPSRAAGPAYPDDDLAASLAAGGRLDALLAAATGIRPAEPPRATGKGKKGKRNRPRPDPDAQRAVPLTWAVDPALLQAVADMTDGYPVRRPGEEEVDQGTGRAAATEWLARLRQRTASDPVLSLPYADADLSALVRANLDDDALDAVAEGRSVVGSVLGVDPDPDLAWPAGGAISLRALNRLRGAGTTTVVLDPTAAPLTTALSYTPTAGTKVSAGNGTLGAAVTDDTISRILAAGSRDRLAAAAESPSPQPSVQSSAQPVRPSGSSSGPGPSTSASPSVPAAVVPAATSPRLVEQRFLAETALITAERPADSQDLLAVPPRQWDPDPQLVANLVADAGRVPWLEPIPLTSVRLDGTEPRNPLTYPSAAQESELPVSYLAGDSSSVRALRTELSVFRSILQPPVGPTAVSLSYATLRTMSVTWRDDLAAGLDLRRRVAEDLARDRGAVSITSRRLITLGSREGTIPITISNDLDQPVTVRLRLTATSTARLVADDTAPLTIAAGHKVTSEIDAVVNQAGVFPVTAQLLTPDDRPYGPPVTLRLRSTAYGQLAVGITAGALAVLFLAVVVRLTRRAVHARRARTVGSAS